MQCIHKEEPVWDTNYLAFKIIFYHTPIHVFFMLKPYNFTDRKEELIFICI